MRFSCRLSVALALALAALAAWPVASAQVPQVVGDASSLKGIASLELDVRLEANLISTGLTEEQVAGWIKAALTAAGIKVCGKYGEPGAADAKLLVTAVHQLATGGERTKGCFAVYRLAVIQPVTVGRSGVKAEAPTWTLVAQADGQGGVFADMEKSTFERHIATLVKAMKQANE